jgi:hypothetical protein
VRCSSSQIAGRRSARTIGRPAGGAIGRESGRGHTQATQPDRPGVLLTLRPDDQRAFSVTRRASGGRRGCRCQPAVEALVDLRVLEQRNLVCPPAEGKSLSLVPRSIPSRSRRACAPVRGRRLARSRLIGTRAYPRPMCSWVGAAIDSWLERLIVIWVRRQRPVLRLVPARWIRPVTRPTVVRLRRSLSRGALALAVPVGIILTLLILVP